MHVVRHAFQFAALVCAAWLFITPQSSAQGAEPLAADDETAVRKVTQIFFEALARRDETVFKSCWDANSPRFASELTAARQTWNSARDIELLRLRFVSTSAVDLSSATVDVEAWLTGFSTQTGKPYFFNIGPGPLLRRLTLKRVDAQWRIWSSENTARVSDAVVEELRKVVIRLGKAIAAEDDSAVAAEWVKDADWLNDYRGLLDLHWNKLGELQLTEVGIVRAEQLDSEHLQAEVRLSFRTLNNQIAQVDSSIASPTLYLRREGERWKIEFCGYFFAARLVRLSKQLTKADREACAVQIFGRFDPARKVTNLNEAKQAARDGMERMLIAAFSLVDDDATRRVWLAEHQFTTERGIELIGMFMELGDISPQRRERMLINAEQYANHRLSLNETMTMRYFRMRHSEAQGRYEEALGHLQKNRDLIDSLDLQEQWLFLRFAGLINQGRLLARLERYIESESALAEASSLLKMFVRRQSEGRFKVNFYPEVCYAYLNRVNELEELEHQAAAADAPQAIALLRKSAPLRIGVYGPVHSKLAESYGVLAELHAEAGQVVDAHQNAERYRSIRGKLFAGSPSEARKTAWLTSYVERLAKMPDETRGKLRQARRLIVGANRRNNTTTLRDLTAAWELKRDVLGDDDLSVAWALNAVADARRDAGDLAGSTTAALQALGTIKKSLGPDAEPVVMNYSTWLRKEFARIDQLVLNSDYQAAIKLSQQAYEVMRDVLGPEHSATLAASSRLEAYRRVEKISPEDAQELTRAVRFISDLVTKGVPKPKNEDAGIDELAAESKEYDRQQDLARRLILARLGEGSEEYRLALMGELRFLASMKPTEAREVSEQLLRHPTLYYMKDLLRRLVAGKMALTLGLWGEAERELAQNIKSTRGEFGEGSEQFRDALVKYTELLTQLDMYPKSSRYAGAAVEMAKRRVLPENHPEIYGEGFITDWTGIDPSVPNARLQEYFDCCFLLGRAELNHNPRLADAAIRQCLFKWYMMTDQGLELSTAMASLWINSGNPELINRAESLSNNTLRIVSDKSEYKSRRLFQSRVFALAGRIDMLRKRFTEANAKFTIALESRGGFVDTQDPFGKIDLLRSAIDASLALEDYPLAARHCLALETATDKMLAEATSSGHLEMIRRLADRVDAQRQLQSVAANVPAAARAPFLQQACALTLRQRAFLVEVLNRTHTAERQVHDDPEAAKIYAELAGIRQRISAVTLQTGDKLYETERTVMRSLLDSQASALDLKLREIVSRKALAAGPENLNQLSTAKVSDIQKQLAPSSRLVEVCRFTRRNFADNTSAEERYGAFILSPKESEPPQWLDLGSVEEIDALVNGYRRAIEDATQSYQRTPTTQLALAERDWIEATNRIGGELHQKLIVPLRSATGPIDTLYLVPDGSLHRLPFAALVDQQGKYLIESLNVVHLNSGRELLPGTPTTIKPSGTVIFAAAEFDERPKAAPTPAPTAPAIDVQVAAVSTQAVPVEVVPHEMRGSKWKDLRSSRKEADDIEAGLKGTPWEPVKKFLGADATEERLKSIHSPRILHLSTHGFFLDRAAREGIEGGPVEGADVQYGQARGFARLRAADNPLLHSGIVLTGANAVGQTAADDGWITAQEVALIDLRGTELVVLSACETGLGSTSASEGVQGLRQSLRYAGAKSVVSSLFKVPDLSTQQLMKDFYAQVSTTDKGETWLRQAQLARITAERNAGRSAHPLFWAGFIFIGRN